MYRSLWEIWSERQKKRQKAQRLVLSSTGEGEKEKQELKKREVAGIAEHESGVKKRLRVKVSFYHVKEEEQIHVLSPLWHEQKGQKDH